MVDLTYLRKKRVRRAVAIVGGVCAAGVIALGAVSALGLQAAPLTIKLSNSNAALGLKRTKAATEAKTFLLAEDCPPYTEHTASLLPTDEKLDSEVSESAFSGDQTSTLYYKYTFYVVNTLESAADYEVVLSINRNDSNTKEFDLTDVLRVRFYENRDLSQHNSKTYAKAKVVTEGGEYKQVPEHISDDSSPLAEMFESGSTILRSEVKNVTKEDTIRYTFVMWLEGYDHDSFGKNAPTDSSLSLGVNISAHEASSNE